MKIAAKHLTRTALVQILSRVLVRRGPVEAARIAATIWPAITGMRLTDRCVDRITSRDLFKLGYEAAHGRFRNAFMKPAEKFAFELLTGHATTLNLYRLLGCQRDRTGWYCSVADARARWDKFHAKRARSEHARPEMLETATARTQIDILAIKAVGELIEIVLTPDRAANMRTTLEDCQ